MQKKSSKPIFIGNWEDSFNFESNKMISYGKEMRDIIVSDDTFVPEKVCEMRKGAIIHKKVRRYAQSIIRPGVKIYDICESIDKKIVELIGENSLNKGIGFPVGLSINECAAHDSALPNDDRVLTNNDVVKIDFGTHYKGNIIDSAFTVAFNPKYDNLLKATYDATWIGIKMAGPGTPIDDISEAIQETIESYEIELDNKIHPVKAIINLGGHTIEPYKIHAGKLLLGGKLHKTDKRMESGECWAIETFATTGDSNFVKSGTGATSHYMLEDNFNRVDLKLKSSKTVLNYVLRNRKTLPFCTRWLDKADKSYGMGIRDLANKKIITPYPPLVSTKNSYTSQFEHTLYLHDFGKEILSYGQDY